MKTINRSKFTNTVCDKQDCDEPRYTRMIGQIVIVMDTPYCERHASEWHAFRIKDLEASYGG
ncbi:hypothetical protein JOF56_002788 [Kibdelosporangium banguiense]|uniref:Uncharacterized protein n=1 Tax=Kibdelosporangium banguiense TaxID=1365924 RepID=A0ABS4TEX0_9PSEU|nr:hypothetical protein [Kibdelosporangium banguiense]MBP2322403.1 hypothetical protein [Kibdelosporangium banguiense]